MGGLLSTEDQSTAANGPKSFYLVLGGPSIQFQRPGRGPLIFDVDPMHTNADDVVEHAEVVKPTANIAAKQMFTLVPSSPSFSDRPNHPHAPNHRVNVVTVSSPTSHSSQSSSSSPLYRLQFSLDYVKPPTSLQVLIDVRIEYVAGVGIKLSARNAPVDHSDAPPRKVLDIHRFESPGPIPLSQCADFPLKELVPALPKDQVALPCSLKECPIVIVLEFEAPPPQQSSGGATTATPLASAANRRDVESDTASDVTAIHKLYTFLTFNKEQLEKKGNQQASGGGGGGATAASGGTTRGGGGGGGDPNEEEMSVIQHPKATVVKQYLEFSGEVYELDDIYDLGGDDLGGAAGVNGAGAVGDGESAQPSPRTPAAIDDVDIGGTGGGAETAVDDEENVCVICLSNPKNTTVIPCRHLCLCSECAVQLRHQTNKCPICRRGIDRLMMM